MRLEYFEALPQRVVYRYQEWLLPEVGAKIDHLIRVGVYNLLQNFGAIWLFTVEVRFERRPFKDVLFRSWQEAHADFIVINAELLIASEHLIMFLNQLIL